MFIFNMGVSEAKRLCVTLRTLWWAALINPPDKMRLVQHVRGDFLDRLGGRIEERDACVLHELLGGGDLVAAVGDGSVGRVGAALAADLVQALGGDGQPEHLA